ncbi:D-glycero-beta-D-manno-heptose-1,7-bisphosphate 7-phosphatase [Candidatus Woesearchaeota archaeon CG10_big_fil_rev_8_21_14_0_10_44_13]|nr:MAG: D-glycero-beta-D-manno-heptose-1,7-bisphosphate 7-phosphatase [Candidatus Woesearchaeota archaeon CG10_big_fil_rev_8_21_14_0_10_44_13]
MAKAIFLDRDGTINVDREYVHKIEAFKLIPRTIDALRMLQDAGYLLIVITNQSGIGRGHYSEKDFYKLNEHMFALFSKNGINISKVYHCPHNPDEGCGCRKPSIKFIKEAEKEFRIDVSKSYVIGDKTADVKMGNDASCKTILVKTGKAGNDNLHNSKPDFIAENLYDAAKIIKRIDHMEKDI